MNRMYLELNRNPRGCRAAGGAMARQPNDEWQRSVKKRTLRDCDDQRQEAASSLPPDYQFIEALINRP